MINKYPATKTILQLLNTTVIHDFDDAVCSAPTCTKKMVTEGFIFGFVTELEVIQSTEDPKQDLYKLLIDNKYGPFFANKIPREIIDSTCLLGPQVTCGQRMLADTSLCDEVTLSFDECNRVVEYHNQSVFDAEFEMLLEEDELMNRKFYQEGSLNSNGESQFVLDF